MFSKILNIYQYILVLGRFFFQKAYGFLASRISYNDEYENELAKENSVLIDAAARLNIGVIDHDGGMLEFRYHDKTTFIRGNATELESAVSHKIAGDKYLVSKILSTKGLPTPSCMNFPRSSIDEACEYFRRMKKPVVVKPRRGTSGGTGITAGIETLADFRKAFYEAALYDRFILIEEFVEGENIRLLILDEQLLSAVKRIPAFVVGDGKNSIKRLIRNINQLRSGSNAAPKLWPIRINNDLRLTLRRQHLFLKAVPDKGMQIFVKTLSNGHQGGVVEEVTKIVHRDFVNMSVRALQFCRVTFGGVDLIARDISRPYAGSGAYINEINTTPSFYGHYQASNQEDIQNCAETFLRYLFEKIS